MERQQERSRILQCINNYWIIWDSLGWETPNLGWQNILKGKRMTGISVDNNWLFAIFSKAGPCVYEVKLTASLFFTQVGSPCERTLWVQEVYIGSGGHRIRKLSFVVKQNTGSGNCSLGFPTQSGLQIWLPCSWAGEAVQGLLQHIDHTNNVSCSKVKGALHWCFYITMH